MDKFLNGSALFTPLKMGAGSARRLFLLRPPGQLYCALHSSRRLCTHFHPLIKKMQVGDAPANNISNRVRALCVGSTNRSSLCFSCNALPPLVHDLSRGSPCASSVRKCGLDVLDQAAVALCRLTMPMGSESIMMHERGLVRKEERYTL